MAKRLKDPVTGYYFIPSREVKARYLEDGKVKSYPNAPYCKSNLSKMGKLYLHNVSVSSYNGYQHSHIFPSKEALEKYIGQRRVSNRPYGLHITWKIEEV
jgi:hypothetical protein